MTQHIKYNSDMSIQYLYPFNLFKNAALPKLFTESWLNIAVDEELPHNGESTPMVNLTGSHPHVLSRC